MVSVEPPGLDYGTGPQHLDNREMSRARAKHPMPNAPQPKAKRGKHQICLGSQFHTEHTTINTSGKAHTCQFPQSGIVRSQRIDGLVERPCWDSPIPRPGMGSQNNSTQDMIPSLLNDQGSEKVSRINVTANGIAEMLALLRLHRKS